LSRLLPWLLVPAAFLAGLAVDANPPAGGVVSTADAPVRVAPSGKARVQIFTPPDPERKSFLGLLTLDPGANVPLHRDESEELIYVLEGGGQIWIDGRLYPLKPGDAAVMPPGSEVRFEGGATVTKVLQIFVPATSARKYIRWKAQ
jgi:quercetin dioxygenase-like cupin family protein